MNFTMKVEMDNDAFRESDDPDTWPACFELARILRDTADRVARCGVSGGKVLDINGNSCGTWKIR